MGNLTSTLTIKLRDDVSAPARAAAEALKGIGASAQDIERLTKIDVFRRLQADFAKARTVFKEAQAQVKALATQMAAADEPGKQLTRAYASAQREVKAASRAFEQQANAIKAIKSQLEAAGVPINQLTAEEKRLATAADAATAALNRQAQRARTMPSAPWGRAPSSGSGVPIVPRVPNSEEPTPRRPGVVSRALGGIAPFAGPGILHVSKAAAESGAQIEHEIVKLRAAGVPESDISRALDESVDLQGKYPNVKRSDTLETYKDLRSVLQHPEEAHHLLDTTVKARSAMNALDPSGHMAEGLTYAIKAAEVLGLAQDPKRYEAYLDAFVKAQQVVGKTITPEGQYELAKYTKASGSALSDRFKTTTAISLAQEMGGSTTGQSIDQFVKQVVGGFQGSQHSAAKEFLAAGLLEKGDLEMTKTGEIKGLKHGHHVKGYKLAQSDPDMWVGQFLMPALQRMGFKTQDEQVAQVRRMFPAGRSADFVSKLITQWPSFENHARLYKQAHGLNAIDINKGDPFVALNSLTTSLTNFAATLTNPAMSGAAAMMSSITETISGFAQSLATFQKQHPEIAKWLGGGALAAGVGTGGALTYQLLTGLAGGFGLGKSAAALDVAAGHLEAAATRLGGGGANVVPTPSGDGGESLGGLLKGLGRRALGPGMIALDASAEIDRKYGTYSLDALLSYITGRADIVGEQGWFAAPGPGSLNDVRARLGLPPLAGEKIGAGADASSTAANGSEIVPPGTTEKAAQAGQQTGAAFGEALKRELEAAQAMAAEFAQRMAHILSFTASPSIDPHFAPAVPGASSYPQHHSSASDVLRGGYSDYGFNIG